MKSRATPAHAAAVLDPSTVLPQARTTLRYPLPGYFSPRHCSSLVRRKSAAIAHASPAHDRPLAPFPIVDNRLSWYKHSS